MSDVNTITTIAHAVGLSGSITNGLLFLLAVLQAVHHFYPDLTANAIKNFFTKPPSPPSQPLPPAK